MTLREVLRSGVFLQKISHIIIFDGCTEKVLTMNRYDLDVYFTLLMGGLSYLDYKVSNIGARNNQIFIRVMRTD